LLTVVIAISFAEIFNLTAVSLWHDESFSALLVEYDFNEMMERIKLDVHPPLYYVFLRGWDFAFGNSLFALRMFSVFFSALAIASVYLFTNQAFKKRGLTILTSLIYAVSYFQVQYAMEARMYALGTFLVVMASYFFLRALEEKKWKWWLLYAIAVSAGIYTHYFVAFWILAHGLYLVYHIFKEAKFSPSLWLKNKSFQLGIGSYLLILISYIPWMGTFLKQTAQVQENYWIPEIGIWSVPNTFFFFFFGGLLDPAQFWYILLALMALVIIVILFFLIRIKNQIKWLILLLLAIPFITTILLSFGRSIYIDRYFIFGFPFYLIIIAGAILTINRKRLRQALIALIILGALTTFPTQWLSIEIEDKPGMAGATSYVNQEAKPNEKIFVGSSLIYFTFKYYNETDIPPQLYAPGEMPHFSGTALLSPEDIIADFNEETKTDDIVWMINTTGFGNYQPIVPSNWIKETENGFQDTYDYLGWIVITKYLVQ